MQLKQTAFLILIPSVYLAELFGCGLYVELLGLCSNSGVFFVLHDGMLQCRNLGAQLDTKLFVFRLVLDKCI